MTKLESLDKKFREALKAIGYEADLSESDIDEDNRTIDLGTAEIEVTESKLKVTIFGIGPRGSKVVSNIKLVDEDAEAIALVVSDMVYESTYELLA